MPLPFSAIKQQSWKKGEGGGGVGGGSSQKQMFWINT